MLNYQRVRWHHAEFTSISWDMPTTTLVPFWEWDYLRVLTISGWETFIFRVGCIYLWLLKWQSLLTGI